MSEAPPEADRETRLADLLQSLSDMPSDERPPLERLAEEHPDLADDLRELWGTMMVVEAVAHQSQTVSMDDQPPRVAVSDVLPPERLGDYELLEMLGRGGMGVVYRAQQRSLQREVALKLILQGAVAREDELKRFQSEAESAAGLEHPNIVPIFEVGETQGWHYIGMKLIRGENLSQRLARGPLPEREGAALIIKVARAIEFAHSQGVIHRDLKPANILIDEEGNPHVSDFGLAKRLQSGASLTHTGEVLGTPAYMAPEQAESGRGEIGPACDVFSMGAILYALVTGRPPFQGATAVDTLLMLLEQDPPPPRLLNPQVTRDLEMILLKSLQKPVELRYASAGALADDLQAHLDGLPISARSGRFGQIVNKVFRETHYAAVLERWSVLWMWHSVVLLVMCVVTNWFDVMRDRWPQMGTPWPYLLLWGGGLAVWAPTFWALRRRGGPVTAVERHIAHAWGASIIGVILLFLIEMQLGMDVLALSPVLGVINGMAFTVKAGILGGAFYFYAAALYGMAIVMAFLQAAEIPYGVTLYGLVSASSFFFPGWKYFRLRRKRKARAERP